jgi:hypothetical protein
MNSCVASRMRAPLVVLPATGPWDGAELDEAVMVVEGMPTRMRSVARGSSSCESRWVSEEKETRRYNTHIPFRLELFQPDKCLCDSLVRQDRLVLLQGSLANLGVVGLGDGILEEGFFELVKSHEDAEDLGQGVLEVALSACLGELHLL